MSKIKTFFFNGQKYQTKQSITINDLLSYFDYQSSLFVLEYNNFICNKKRWKRIYIQSNDKIELISIVGGG
jgi:thiamine biosynthesis protein ThiS